MNEQNLRSIIDACRDILRKDAGLSGDVDRISQLTWIIFLKCFDDFEKKQEILDRNYESIIPIEYRWRDWADEKNKKSLTGNDLKKFVNDDLFPTLANLISNKHTPQRDIISSIFKQFFNSIESGFSIRRVVNKINEIEFTSDFHIFATFYETMLLEMRNAAGDDGEFYTPRPVIRFIVEEIRPDLSKSERILDPAAGTGGFLIESIEYMRKDVKSKKSNQKLVTNTVFGIEKKPMPYLLGIMNMILHDIEKPNIMRANTLGRAIKDIGEEDQYEIIMTNPPFGGSEEEELKMNLPRNLQTSDTALAFLVFIMNSLKKNGKCAIILPDGSPLSKDGVPANIRKMLIEEFNLHTIIRLPKTVFEPYTSIATNILFFDNSGKTKDIWYYQMKVSERLRGVTRAKEPKYTMTNPIIDDDFKEVQKWLKNKKENENAWKVSVDNLVDYSLDIKNPSEKEEVIELDPNNIINDIIKNEKEIQKQLNELKKITRDLENE